MKFNCENMQCAWRKANKPHDRYCRMMCPDFIPETEQSASAPVEDYPSAGSDNPFCENCDETDCGVSLDGTCNMIRQYKKAIKDGVHVCEFGMENKCLVCGVAFTPNASAEFRLKETDNAKNV